MKAVKTRALVRILVATINSEAGSLICKTPSAKGVDGWTPVLRKGKQWPDSVIKDVAQVAITAATKEITKRAILSLNPSTTPGAKVNNRHFLRDLALNGNVNPMGRKYPGTVVYYKAAPYTERLIRLGAFEA